MDRFVYLIPVLVLACLTVSTHGAGWKKIRLTDQFFSEGATFADIDRDGVMDVISGPYWWKGPDFKKKFAYYEPASFDPKAYSKNFFAFSHDINGDGFPDIMVIGFPGEDASWFENPATSRDREGAEPFWKRHLILAHVDNESPTFADVNGDGRPELVCM